jgi:hypothetical protein
VCQHRIGPERNRATVVFDRPEGLATAERRIRAGEQASVIALTGRRLVGDRGGDRQHRKNRGNQKCAFHKGFYPNRHECRRELSGPNGV